MQVISASVYYKCQNIHFRKPGQEVKLSTILITFNTPNIPTSISTDLYKVRVNPYVPNPVRCFKCQKFGHGQRQCKGNIIVSRRAMMITLVKMISNVPIVVNPISPFLKTINFI